MSIQLLQQELVAYAHEIGIDKIGFTTAASFPDLKTRLYTQQKLGFASGFEESDIELRTTPIKLLPNATSIIAIAVAYPSKMKERVVGKKGARRGIFCRASWGIDYHTALRERLAKLEVWLKEKVPEVDILSMVDTGALVDRAVAERAGIGWSGKNCSIITHEFGSYVYLGELVTNIPFVPDEPIEEACGDCTLCLDVCPTGALVNPGQLDAQRCIAFLTQTKGVMPMEFRKHIGNRLYGCDTCQTVCPKNKGKVNWMHEEFTPDPELAKPLLEPLLHMTNREFKDKFGHVSGSWRGKKPIQRNALIALANFKEESAVPAIIDVLDNDPRPEIRATAAYALGEIPNDKVALQNALLKEQEDMVLHEIKLALGEEL